MKTLNLFLLILAITTLSACSNSKTQIKKYYRINATPTSSLAAVKPLTLVIKRPSAHSILGGRPMVATKEDNALIQLSHHFWLESPKILLQDILKSWALTHWQSVSYLKPYKQPHQILDTRILAFEKNKGQAKVILEFFLYDENSTLIFNQLYEQNQPLTEDGYHAFSESISTAIQTILEQLSADI